MYDADWSDEDLVARCAAGDRAALTTIYNRYASVVFSLVVRIVGEGMAAEEATQDTFLSLWRRAAQYSPERGRVLAWLLTIARNRAIDEVRRGRATAHAPELTDQTPHPVALEDVSLRRVQMQRLLAELPAAQREVIELAYYGGLTQQEIAEQLNTPLGTVKTRMRLALQRLRSALAEPGRVTEEDSASSMHPSGDRGA